MCYTASRSNHLYAFELAIIQAANKTSLPHHKQGRSVTLIVINRINLQSFLFSYMKMIKLIPFRSSNLIRKESQETSIT